MSVSPLPPANLDLGTTLDERLEALNGVDKKVEEIMDGTRQIMENLIKDNKQMSKSKMEESMRRFGKTLDEEISKVIQEQLNYMEQLCAGSEHQGSTMSSVNRAVVGYFKRYSPKEWRDYFLSTHFWG
ncbi:Mediator of RNA polymerase II transcription subunit 11 [Aphelenchoides fujianensis]|nr:Mediator of RNA polymerase II transcription subunit 11 [Aphelenchoides fujianensis]